MTPATTRAIADAERDSLALLAWFHAEIEERAALAPAADPDAVLAEIAALIDAARG